MSASASEACQSSSSKSNTSLCPHSLSRCMTATTGPITAPHTSSYTRSSISVPSSTSGGCCPFSCSCSCNPLNTPVSLASRPNRMQCIACAVYRVRRVRPRHAFHVIPTLLLHPHPVHHLTPQLHDCLHLRFLTVSQRVGPPIQESSSIYLSLAAHSARTSPDPPSPSGWSNQSPRGFTRLPAPSVLSFSRPFLGPAPSKKDASNPLPLFSWSSLHSHGHPLSH